VKWITFQIIEIYCIIRLRASWWKEMNKTARDTVYEIWHGATGETYAQV
jgi:hypothetical protein